MVPLIGLGLFWRMKNKMIKDNISSPPILDLFIVFATYGGLLLVTLTTLFWEWSGMASLGTFYLILVAPFVMGVISYKNYKQRQDSKYHGWTFESGIVYFIIAPLTFLGLFYLNRQN